MPKSTNVDDVPRSHPFIAALDSHIAALDQRLRQGNPADTSLRASVVHEWDRAERALGTLVFEIRARRNLALSYIFRLPPEIFLTIFSLVSNFDPPQMSISESIMDRYNVFKMDVLDDLDTNTWDHIRVLEAGSLGWWRITHVCAHWRRLILQNHQLWADQLGRLPRAAEECLSRAGDTLPLTVTTICTSAEHSRNWSLIIPKASKTSTQTESLCSRIQGLHVLDIREDVHPLDESYADIEFNCLEVMDLARAQMSLMHPAVEVWGRLPLLRAPRLRTIMFRNIAVPWQSNALTYLSIHLWCATKIPSSSLLEMLARSRETLQFLELIHVTPKFAPGFSTSAIQELHLPRLKTLHFADKDEQEASFLRIVHLPPTVDLQLDIYCEPDIDPTWDSPSRIGIPVELSLERSHCGPDLDSVCIASRRSSLDPDEDSRIDMSMYRDAMSLLSKEGAPLRERPKLRLVVDANGNPYPLPRVVQSLCGALGTGRFTFVSLNLPAWEVADITSVISRFPNVTMLCVFNPLNVTRDREGPIWDPDSDTDSDEYEDPGFAYFPQATPDSTHQLEMLWIIQTQALCDTLEGWCDRLASQFRTSFLDQPESVRQRYKKSIKTLRLEFSTQLSNEESLRAECVAQTPLDPYVDAVQWVHSNKATDEVVHK